MTEHSAHCDAGRHHRNAHLLELDGCDWRCLICGHWFDAAIDADLFMCGEDCTGKHYGDGVIRPGATS